MATDYKRLGALTSSGVIGTADTLYMCGVESSVVSTVAITNRAATSATYRVAVSTTATFQDAGYIVYDATVPANDTIFLTLGATLDTANKYLLCSASAATVSFSGFGVENTASGGTVLATGPGLTDSWYSWGVDQTSDGLGADTWGAEANGQDYANDGILDEEAIARTQADHDTYGGSGWSITAGSGALLNTYNGLRLRFDPKPPADDHNTGIQLSWAQESSLQDSWAMNYVGFEGDYGYTGSFPATFRDEWITGYRIWLRIMGGEGEPFFIQFVSGLADDSPTYTGGTVHPKIYIPYQGVPWNNGGSSSSGTWYNNILSYPVGTPGFPDASWTGTWRMRIGMDEENIAPGAPVQTYEIDLVRVYVDFELPTTIYA